MDFKTYPVKTIKPPTPSQNKMIVNFEGCFFSMISSFWVVFVVVV